MRRYVPLLIAGIAMLAAACSDATAPFSAVSSSDLSAVSAPSAAAKRHARTSQVSYEAFVVPVGGGQVKVGEFTLTFPANSVCRLNSGYGKRFWDKPCQTVAFDLPVVAKYWYENGEFVVEFSPDIRFSPDAVVIVSTFRPELIGATSLGNYEILSWTRGAGGRSREDDVAADPSLQTHFNPVTGEVFRRIKHFSGISISSGATCDEYCGSSGSSEY